MDPPHLKIVQGFSNSGTVKGGMRKSKITVKGGCCKKREMRNFAGVRGIVSSADGNLRRSNFDQLNIFQS